MHVLEGRRAVVTGAARGLGEAFARALAGAGAAVAIGDVDDAVCGVGAQLESGGATAWASVVDVARPEQVRTFVDEAADRLGGVDVVVNNAGIARTTSPATDPWERALDDFDSVIAVNLRGAYLVGRAAIPYLVRDGGDIVNITTDHVHTCGFPRAVDHVDAAECPWAATRRPPVGGPAFDVYDASKAGLMALTRVWSRALAPHGVRVNSLGMGATDTPMYREHRGDRPLPNGILRPEAVAAVLVELVAEGPAGRTGDSVQLWLGHACRLGPVGIDGQLLAPGRAGERPAESAAARTTRAPE